MRMRSGRIGYADLTVGCCRVREGQSRSSSRSAVRMIRDAERIDCWIDEYVELMIEWSHRHLPCFYIQVVRLHKA